ncbi:MAG: hypothetical protein JW969_11095 [Spirochaetales bacterium]|nr:hypothetical protein [Spirochaetales bacterium]
MQRFQSVVLVLFILLTAVNCFENRNSEPPQVDSGNNGVSADNKGLPPPVLKAVITDLRASSTLPDDEEIPTQPDVYKKRILYSVYNLFDGDPRSTWVEGNDGDGFGEDIVVTFNTEVMIDAIEVMPGYFINNFYDENNKVKTLRVIADGMEADKLGFAEKMEPQMVKLKSALSAKKIKFVIEEIYRGTKWHDTCISEIAFWNGSSRIELGLDRLVKYVVGSYRLSPFSSLTLYLDQFGEGTRPAASFTLNKNGSITGNLSAQAQYESPVVAGNWHYYPANGMFLLDFDYDKFTGTFSMEGTDDRWEKIHDEVWLEIYSNTLIGNKFWLTSLIEKTE